MKCKIKKIYINNHNIKSFYISFNLDYTKIYIMNIKFIIIIIVDKKQVRRDILRDYALHVLKHWYNHERSIFFCACHHVISSKYWKNIIGNSRMFMRKYVRLKNNLIRHVKDFFNVQNSFFHTLKFFLMIIGEKQCFDRKSQHISKYIYLIQRSTIVEACLLN